MIEKFLTHLNLPINNELDFNIITYCKFKKEVTYFPGTNREPIGGDSEFVGIRLLLSK